MNEQERRILNQLNRELVLLIGDVETSAKEFARRYNHIRVQAAQLSEDIDKKLDDKGEADGR